MKDIITFIFSGIISLGLAALSIIMYQAYKRFMKGEFKSICFWTMIILISVAFHELAMFLHPIVDEIINVPHETADTLVHVLLYSSFPVIITSAIMLIKYFKAFSDRFGLVGKIRKPAADATANQQDGIKSTN